MNVEHERRFVTLYEQNWRALLGYALRRASGPEEAADVVAESFLVAWRRIEEVPPGGEARPWLFGVARRGLANHQRSSLRRNRLGDRLKQHLLTEAPASWTGRSETALMVRSAMDRLDDDDRELLRLANWEGSSPTDIAIAMGIPAATVRTRLHRARHRLRSELTSMGVSGERLAPAGHVEAGEQPLPSGSETQQ